MIQEDPKLQNSKLEELPEDQEQVAADPVDTSVSSGTVKEAVTKEVKELIKSYVDYAKNVEL